MSYIISVAYVRAKDEVSVLLYCSHEDECRWTKVISEGYQYYEIDSLDVESYLQQHESEVHSD